MKPELVEAFGTLLVGMITVFTVLALVVATGRALIWSVNRTTKELPSVKKGAIQKSKLQEEINAQKMAAIVAAVEIITNGKGKITSIEIHD
jgi:oxaloacetate decarboxylase gamma subunit